MVLALIAGIACGVGQFFLLRRTLRPLSEGKNPSALMLLSQLPIPIVLLLGCAMINVTLLPFAGGGFCGAPCFPASIMLIMARTRREFPAGPALKNKRR